MTADSHCARDHRGPLVEDRTAESPCRRRLPFGCPHPSPAAASVTSRSDESPGTGRHVPRRLGARRVGTDEEERTRCPPDRVIDRRSPRSSRRSEMAATLRAVPVVVGQTDLVIRSPPRAARCRESTLTLATLIALTRSAVLPVVPEHAAGRGRREGGRRARTRAPTRFHRSTNPSPRRALDIRPPLVPREGYPPKMRLPWSRG